jgi:hypothetical protein
VCAYGPRAEHLAGHAVERIRAWDTGRGLPTQIEVYPSGTPIPGPGEDILLVADKRHTRVVVRSVNASVPAES